MSDETKRIVEYKEEDWRLWDITCPTCPLKIHADALDQKAPSCTHGIATNMQGPVALGKCRYNKKDSLVDESGILSLLCSHPTRI